MDPLDILRNAGLAVVESDPEEETVFLQGALKYGAHFWFCKYTIQKPSNHPTYNQYQEYCISNPNRPLDSLTSQLLVNFKTGEWRYRCWERIPGPSDDDFIAFFDSLEDVVSAVSRFYFHQSSLIAGWLIPLHRHPELHRGNITSLLVDAIKVNNIDFQDICTQRELEVASEGSTVGWYQAIRYRFLACRHTIDPNDTLWIRRDGRECYIVAS